MHRERAERADPGQVVVALGDVVGAFGERLGGGDADAHGDADSPPDVGPYRAGDADQLVLAGGGEAEEGLVDRVDLLPRAVAANDLYW
ncbi:hypothetical protein GCM10027591_02950 [Zhihengliuella somnathii]